MIAANVSFLLCSRPSFDSTLGGDRIDYSRIVFGVHERHWASAKRVATIVEPKGMFADPLVDRPPRDSRIVAAVCATQNVDRRAIQEPVPLELVAHPIIEAKSLQLGGGLTGAPESCPSRRAFGAPQDEGDLRSGPRSLRQEKAHHDAGGVEAYALGKAAVRIAAEPGVPAAFDQPLFRDRQAVGAFQRSPADAATLDWPVEVASCGRSLSALDLIEDAFAVDGIDCSVSQPVKDDLAGMSIACGERRGIKGRRSLHRGEGGWDVAG